MIEIAIAGALGGLSKSLAEGKGRVVLPKYEGAEDGTKYVHLGFAVNVILGAIVAGYLTTDLGGAFTSGISAAFVIEKFFEKTVV